MEDFDAVVFHIRDMENGKIALPNQKRRKPHQRYVMFLMESPLNDDFPYESFGNFFNWYLHRFHNYLISITYLSSKLL